MLWTRFSNTIGAKLHRCAHNRLLIGHSGKPLPSFRECFYTQLQLPPAQYPLSNFAFVQAKLLYKKTFRSFSLRVDSRKAVPMAWRGFPVWKGWSQLKLDQQACKCIRFKTKSKQLWAVSKEPHPPKDIPQSRCRVREWTLNAIQRKSSQ